MKTEMVACATPLKLPSEVKYMLNHINKFTTKPNNVPSEEQYMTNRNAKGTLNLLGSNRDKTDEKSRIEAKKAFEINELQRKSKKTNGDALDKLTLCPLSLGSSLSKASISISGTYLPPKIPKYPSL